MQIGYVTLEKLLVQQGEERVEKKWLKLSIRPIFGTKQTFTMKKNQSDVENSPDYDIYAHSGKGWIDRNAKAGSLWIKVHEGVQYMTGYIETPLVEGGKLYISLWKAKPLYDAEKVEWLYDVSWKPYNPNAQSSNNNDSGTPSDNEIPHIDIDEDEIPF